MAEIILGLGTSHSGQLNTPPERWSVRREKDIQDSRIDFRALASKAKAGIEKERVQAWILHGGGRDVLDALGERLQLDETELSWSRRVLLKHGNLSSPMVLFSLHEALQNQASGGWWFMGTFGAGFSCHGALLKVAD